MTKPVKGSTVDRCTSLGPYGQQCEDDCGHPGLHHAGERFDVPLGANSAQLGAGRGFAWALSTPATCCGCTCGRCEHQGGDSRHSKDCSDRVAGTAEPTHSLTRVYSADGFHAGFYWVRFADTHINPCTYERHGDPWVCPLIVNAGKWSIAEYVPNPSDYRWRLIGDRMQFQERGPLHLTASFAEVGPYLGVLPNPVPGEAVCRDCQAGRHDDCAGRNAPGGTVVDCGCVCQFDIPARGTTRRPK